MQSKSNGSTDDSLLTQLTGVLQSRDDARLGYLKQSALLTAAEATAMQAEQARISRKYGANSAQAADAAARLAALELEATALAAEIGRASMPAPAVTPDAFVVYGRVLNAQENGMTGVKLNANSADGTTLASCTSKAQGTFELRIPFAAKRKKAAAKAPEESATGSPVAIQLVASGKGLVQPYICPETISAIGGRMAYRELMPAQTPTTEPSHG